MAVGETQPPGEPYRAGVGRALVSDSGFDFGDSHSARSRPIE
jgi:hypothetical protein